MSKLLAGEIAERLRRARTARELSGAEVGRRLGGLTPSQISKMETGKQTIPCELLPAWCEVVGTTLAEVYGAEQRHHFAQVPFSPHVARLYSQLPTQWQLHIQRAVQSLFQLYKKDKSRS
ncbi:helix-turn-helix domain-containing protein [Microbulbifer sp. JSM ZJ756]|uniref:helix-turn-helix domain-containing protein n=1 Tax=Microbulbifer sp. JSM ZJ756 TaxID=3376191 RepID=UPI003787A41E